MSKPSAFQTASWIRLIIAVTLVSSPALASESSQPVFRPTLQIEKAAGPIDIDGRLDDQAWETASRATGFVEINPGDNTEPEVKTEVFVTYDDHNLYVAFICHDDPKAVRATMCQRDQFSGDDAMALLVDTYGDAAWAYEFFVNPYGIQKDYLWTSVGAETGGTEDVGYDLIWKSAAQITDSGYQVELAIPFASIRFPNREAQTWKVNFRRHWPRESSKQYSWAAVDRNEQCGPCQWGTLTGIRDVHSGKGIEILPTVVAHQSGDLRHYTEQGPRFRNDDPKGELSLGGKYAVTSDMTVEASINPDFSQIEADAAQIDVNSTIALFYPERRPFFQEGSDIFRTLFNSFYTRMINDPQLTAKFTGRMGRSSIGFLTAYDENTPYMIPLEERTLIVNSGKSVANVLRGSRAFGDNSMIGFFVSDRRFEGDGSGSIAALDGNIRLSKNYCIDGQYIASHTREPNDTSLTLGLESLLFDKGRHTAAFDGESYYGSALITRLRRDARNWNFLVDYSQASPSYRTEIGFDPVMDYRNLSVWSGYNIYPKNGVFDVIIPQLYAFRKWSFGGVRKSEENAVSLDGRIKIAQTYFSLAYFDCYELWGGVEFDDLWIVDFHLGSRLSDEFGYDLSLTHGRSVARYALVKDSETSLDVSITFKPIDRLVIEPDLSFFQGHRIDTGEELFYGYITRTRVQYQANRELSFRLVVQYDDFDQAWDIDPLLTYRVSSFSVLYVGSAYDYANLVVEPDPQSRWKMTSRQFFVKLQYLFQT